MNTKTPGSIPFTGTLIIHRTQALTRRACSPETPVLMQARMRSLQDCREDPVQNPFPFMNSLRTRTDNQIDQALS